MLFHPQIRSRYFLNSLLGLAILLIAGLFHSVSAQEGPTDPYEKPPVFVTVRVFTARVKKGAGMIPSEETYRLKTVNLTDYEKWVTPLSKAYPGFEIALLRTEVLRIFKSNKPGTVFMGPRNERNLHLDIFAANSPGDGVTPGLDLIPVVEYHFGDDQTDKKYPPVMMAFPPPLNVEPGMTYFFSGKQLSYKPESYVNFLRPGFPAKEFENDEYFFVFVITPEAENPAKPGGDQPSARVLTDKQAAELQASATKKVEPEWPVSVKRPGFSGKVQVQVKISPEGRIEWTNIWNSILPEANQQIIAAARQWEFPATLFADSKLPVYTILTFTNTAPPAPKTEAPKSPATSQPGSKVGAPVISSTAPVKAPAKTPAKRPASKKK